MLRAMRTGKQSVIIKSTFLGLLVLAAGGLVLTDVQGVFNRGVYVAPTPFEEILGPNGELLWSRRVDGDRGRRAVPSDIADAMLWMLQQVVNGGTGGGAALPGRPVAGKTGTSEGGRDLWFIGGIPQLATGLWLGYDNNRETKSTSAVAVVAWADYMRPIVKDLPVRLFPPKPVLTGRFNPLKALRPRKPGQAAGNAPAAAPEVPAEGRWRLYFAGRPAEGGAGAAPWQGVGLALSSESVMLGGTPVPGGFRRRTGEAGSSSNGAAAKQEEQGGSSEQA